MQGNSPSTRHCSDQAIEVRYKPARLALLFLYSLGFVAASIWLLTLDPHESSSAMRKFGWTLPWLPWVAIIFSGGCDIFIALAVFDRRAQLLIGPRGIRWRRWSKVEIPWSQVTSAEIKSMRKQPFVVLKLRDPSAYPGRGILGLLSWINRKMGFGDITITAPGLDHSAEEILAAINRFRGGAD